MDKATAIKRDTLAKQATLVNARVLIKRLSGRTAKDIEKKATVKTLRDQLTSIGLPAIGAKRDLSQRLITWRDRVKAEETPVVEDAPAAEDEPTRPSPKIGRYLEDGAVEQPVTKPAPAGDAPAAAPVSDILKTFNDKFVNIAWENEDRVRRLISEIPAKVAADSAYRNARENSDRPKRPDRAGRSPEARDV